MLQMLQDPIVVRHSVATIGYLKPPANHTLELEKEKFYYPFQYTLWCITSSLQTLSPLGLRL